MITAVFHLTSLDELSAAQSETIIQFIDMYEFEIYGWKTAEWSENLRPTLLRLISGEHCKLSC